MKPILVAAALLAPVSGYAAQTNACSYWDGAMVKPSQLANIDARCHYSAQPSVDGFLRIQLQGVKPESAPGSAPVQPVASPEMLEILRMDIERRQMELDAMDRARREQANRNLGMFLPNQAFRTPAIQPQPVIDPNARRVLLDLEDFLNYEAARHRRCQTLGPAAYGCR